MYINIQCIHLAKSLAYSSSIVLKINVLQSISKAKFDFNNRSFRKETCRSKELMTVLSRPIRFWKLLGRFVMHYFNDKPCF